MLRFLTAGESHGPLLTGLVDGLPAGLPLSAADIDPDLTRRQRGYGSGGRMPPLVASTSRARKEGSAASTSPSSASALPNPPVPSKP